MKYLQKKKLAFMTMVDIVKGFVRSVSGIWRVTLSDCVDDDSLTGYTISGNSVQDGTPTPEMPVEVESVGEYDESTGKYKIPVICSGKNMFDKDGFCEAYNSYGTLVATLNDSYLGENCFSYYLKYPVEDFAWLSGKFKENTQYTISCYAAFQFMDLDSRAIPIIAIRYTDGTIFSVVGQLNRDDFSKVVAVSSADKTIDCLFVQNFAANAKVYFKDFQIEEGATATEYEKYRKPVVSNIYLDEPLRRVGDYTDDIDFEKRTVVRRIYCERLSSTNLREMISGNTSRYYKSVSKKILSVIYRGGYSNYFTIPPYKYSNELSNNEAMLSPSATFIYIRCDELTLDEYKQFLDNENVLIYYVLAETEETPITLSKPPTIKGTTIYSVDTTVQPSNMKVSYYSTSKE